MFPMPVSRCLAESSPPACGTIWPMQCGMGRQTMDWCNAFNSWCGPTYHQHGATLTASPTRTLWSVPHRSTAAWPRWKPQTRSACNLTMKLRRYSSNGLPIWSNASGAKKLHQSCKRILPSTAA